MLQFYRWIVGCTLLVGFLGGTFVFAKSTEVQQQILKRNRDNMTVLTIGSHGVGPFYLGKKSDGLTDPVENNLFDIFCSAVDTEWLRPGQNSFTPVLHSLRGLASKPAMPTRRRYQLRPCWSFASSHLPNCSISEKRFNPSSSAGPFEWQPMRKR